ncbi:MAG TPA: hypothetical protein VG963_31710, partial [Polyangiaceae bacterium]|nr:hypothetical protein [Polyangiaceae bacterium]
MRKRTFGARLATLFVVVMANIGCGDDNSGDAVAARVNSSSAFGSYHTFAFATADQSTPAGAAIPADVQSDLTLINDAV